MVRPSQRRSPSVEEKDMIFALVKAVEMLAPDVCFREPSVTIPKRFASHSTSTLPPRK
jgi:hypothetical protein